MFPRNIANQDIGNVIYPLIPKFLIFFFLSYCFSKLIHKTGLKSMLVCCYETWYTETMQVQNFFEDDLSRKKFFGLSFSLLDLSLRWTPYICMNGLFWFSSTQCVRTQLTHWVGWALFWLPWLTTLHDHCIDYLFSKEN